MQMMVFKTVEVPVVTGEFVSLIQFGYYSGKNPSLFYTCINFL